MAVLSLCAAAAFAQEKVVVKGFKYGDYYGPPHELQLSWVLQGAQARPQSDGRSYAIEQATLQTFSATNGQVQLILKTPQCVLTRPNSQESIRASARSSGAIQMQTADGQFSLEGVGFVFHQADPCIVISNRVHSVVRVATLGHATGAAESGVGSESATNQTIEVGSDHFDYSTNSGLATYREQVRLTGSNLVMTAAALECELPVARRRLERVTALTNVVMDYDFAGGAENHLHATGGRASYQIQTGAIEVTGQPAWHAGQRQGSSRELYIDRTNRVLRATGDARLSMPGRGMEGAVLPAAPAEGKPRASANTNRFIDVFADSYEFHTNSALFVGHVRVAQREGEVINGTMECARMALAFKGTNLQELVAEENVVFNQEQGRMTAGRAVYTALTRELELTQKPAWQGRSPDGKREFSGKGDRIIIDAVRDDMLVTGNASMRLPASDLGRVLPGRDAAADGQESEAADVFASEYRVMNTNVTFRGGVYVSHPRMNLSCETLSVARPEDTRSGQTNSMLAEERVSFDLTLPPARRELAKAEASGKAPRETKIHGTGDKAWCNYSIAPAGANNFTTNSVLQIVGEPAMLQMMIETNTTVATNTVLELDLIHKRLSIPGNYGITSTVPAVTNKSASADKLFK
jgi:lipopolysaccharide export system protein LptA